MNSEHETVDILRDTVRSYRKLVDRTLEQLSDEEFFRRPAPGTNSVAVILRHLGGNLASRWTDFLTTDGEKQSRDRDQEFADWEGTRIELMHYFETGWKALTDALNEIDETVLDQTIFIRGESHTVRRALIRSVTHLTYHVGQISMTARMAHDGNWDWLTIPPNRSAEFNRENWGTSKSRAVFGEEDEPQ